MFGVGILTKIVITAIAVSGVGIGMHFAYNGWSNTIKESEQKSIAIEGYKKEITARDERYAALKEFHEKARQEVEWARYYREKQDARIAELQAHASPEIQECINMQIDPRLLGW